MAILSKDANFGYMLTGIVLFTVFGPLAEEFFGDADGFVLMVAYSSMLIIGIWSLQTTRVLFSVGVLLASLCVGMTLIDLFTDNVNLSIYLMTALFIFQCMSMWIACGLVFSTGSITLNRLMGGVCIFMLLGLTWNILYVFLVYFDPSSFEGLPENALVDQDVYWDMTYFSFVTLTTLGYGDITPAGTMARVLAYSEAVVGQLYLAILIGALVGSYMRGREGDNT
jgi:voltage-gated potassium channel